MTNVKSMFAGYTSQVFGEKIFSEKLDHRLLSVLELDAPDRKGFYFYAKTLKECNFSIDEIISVTEEAIKGGRCVWKIYNPGEFKSELHKIFKDEKQSTVCTGATFNRAPANPKVTGKDIVEIFKTLPVFPPILDLSSNILYAVMQYYNAGFTPLPVNKLPCNNPKCLAAGRCKHPSLGIKWKEYQNRQPTFKELFSWDWSNGICLLANDKYCFLDIDPEGTGLLDDSLLIGRHWEKTERGTHIFSLSDPGIKSYKADGIELKAAGTLIVVSPTPKYVSCNRM